jgi:hypothetical protein
MATAAAFLLVAMLAGYRFIGWPPVVIVGGSGVAAFVLWNLTYLRRPLMPELVLPPFLLTVAALEAHMIEEYLTGFAPAMSRLFNISWSEPSFLMVRLLRTSALFPHGAGALPARSARWLSHVLHLHRPRCR